MRFDKVRYHYFRDFNNNPHSCLVVRVIPETNEIFYAVVRRESADGLVRLKKRMQTIRELGGIVPESLHQELRAFRKDYSKQRARFVACRRLENQPQVIEGISVAGLNGHQITRLVMEAIVANNTFMAVSMIGDIEMPTIIRGQTEQVRLAAQRWLNKNVPEYRTTADIKFDNSAIYQVKAGLLNFGTAEENCPTERMMACSSPADRSELAM